MKGYDTSEDQNNWKSKPVTTRAKSYPDSDSKAKVADTTHTTNVKSKKGLDKTSGTTGRKRDSPENSYRNVIRDH